MKTSIFLLLVFALLFLYRMEVAALVLRPLRSIDRFRKYEISSCDRIEIERREQRKYPSGKKVSLESLIDSIVLR